MLVVFGSFVHSQGSEQLALLTKHAVFVESDGAIAYFGPAESCPAVPGDAQVIHLKPTQFLAPGFIDAHIHAPQFPNTGIFSETLLEWLDMYTFPLEAKFQDVDIAKQVYNRVVKRSLQNGTTTSSYYGTVHVPATVELAKMCQKLGQRALVGRVCMERFCPAGLQDAKLETDVEYVDAVQKLDPKGELVKPVITPRFAPSCTASTLAQLGKLARDRDLPVQTHISESAGEIELVAQCFPECANYADVYAQAGLLKHDTILAHAIHLKQVEVEAIKRYDSGLVHCPMSNAALSSGLAPVKQYLKQGVKVALGTDVSAGATTSILEMMRLAISSSNLLSERLKDKGHQLSLANAFYLATLGGARVCGLEAQTGNFSEGKQFDAQLVDILAHDSPVDLFDFQLPGDETERLEYLVKKWVYIGDDRNTIQVWVSGHKVHERVRA